MPFFPFTTLKYINYIIKYLSSFVASYFSSLDLSTTMTIISNQILFNWYEIMWLACRDIIILGNCVRIRWLHILYKSWLIASFIQYIHNYTHSFIQQWEINVIRDFWHHSVKKNITLFYDCSVSYDSFRHVYVEWVDEWWSGFVIYSNNIYIWIILSICSRKLSLSSFGE